MKAKASTRRETQHLESFYPSEKKSSRTHLQKIVADHLSISPFLIAEVAQRRHPWGKNWGGVNILAGCPPPGAEEFLDEQDDFLLHSFDFSQLGVFNRPVPRLVFYFFKDPMVAADGWEARLSKRDLGRWSFSSFLSSNEKLRTHHWSHSSSVFTSRVEWN